MIVVVMTKWYRSSRWEEFGEFDDVGAAIERKKSLENRYHPFAVFKIYEKIEKGHYRPVEVPTL